MIQDGGYAFPAATCGDWQNGMTLRDWFAGQALQGILAAPSPLADQAWKSDAIAAEWSYKLADAMLEARKEKL